MTENCVDSEIPDYARAWGNVQPVSSIPDEFQYDERIPIASIFRLVVDNNGKEVLVTSKGCDGCKIAKQACDKRRPRCGRCKGPCVYSQPGYTMLRERQSRQRRYESDGSRSRVAKLDCLKRSVNGKLEKSSNVVQLHETPRPDNRIKGSYAHREIIKRSKPSKIDSMRSNEKEEPSMVNCMLGEFVFLNGRGNVNVSSSNGS